MALLIAPPYQLTSTPTVRQAASICTCSSPRTGRQPIKRRCRHTGLRQHSPIHNQRHYHSPSPVPVQGANHVTVDGASATDTCCGTTRTGASCSGRRPGRLFHLVARLRAVHRQRYRTPTGPLPQLATGTDGVSHILWNNTSTTDVMLWNVNKRFVQRHRRLWAVHRQRSQRRLVCCRPLRRPRQCDAPRLEQHRPPGHVLECGPGSGAFPCWQDTAPTPTTRPVTCGT